MKTAKPKSPPKVEYQVWLHMQIFDDPTPPTVAVVYRAEDRNEAAIVYRSFLEPYLEGSKHYAKIGGDEDIWVRFVAVVAGEVIDLDLDNWFPMNEAEERAHAGPAIAAVSA